jgi:Uma2 family endonuclease
MSGPPKPRATYADVLAAPEHMIAEIIDGVLHTQPRPASPHARAAGKLGATLDGPFDSGENGPGGWILLFEPELHLHGEILVPDFAGWRRERMPQMPDAPAFELAPDWVCEVLSPGTAATDRAQKMPMGPGRRLARRRARADRAVRGRRVRPRCALVAVGDRVERYEPRTDR